MGSQADNRQMPAAGPLPGADVARSFDPVHFRHLQVHQRQVEVGSGEKVQGLAPVPGGCDCMAAILEQAVGDLLVEGVVLDQQNLQGLRRGRHFRAGIGHCGYPQCSDQRLVEIGLGNGFAQVAADAQRVAAGDVLALVSR